MLQIDVRTYASDALEDALRLAQIKALNSYTWSDCLNFLNYVWRDIYDRIAMIDSGYYSKTVRIPRKLTHLPPFVRNTVKVYRSESPHGHARLMYSSSGMADLQSEVTYHISGTELFIPSAERCKVWLEYVPQPKQLMFTMYNRDPKILTEAPKKVSNNLFHMYRLALYKGEDDDKIEVPLEDARDEEITGAVLWNRNSLYCDWPHVVIDTKRPASEMNSPLLTKDHINLTHVILDNEYYPEWKLIYVHCDYPYIFLTYQHRTMREQYMSGIINKNWEWSPYNPFDFAGRPSNVEYYDVKWNDKTGLYAHILDHADNQYKEIGWTPDSLIEYPAPDVYRYLVAKLAEKFSALNETTVMAVQSELVDARYAFEAFLEKDKSSWKRINNVVGTTWGDWL